MKRGRKSAEDLKSVESIPQRPDPPKDLSVKQRNIWRETVKSEPVDFFSTEALQSMLKNYCAHTEAAEIMTGIVDGFTPEMVKDDSSQYNQFLKMRGMEVRNASLLAVKLRLTNQSRYTPKTAATAGRNAPRYDLANDV